MMFLLLVINNAISVAPEVNFREKMVTNYNVRCQLLFEAKLKRIQNKYFLTWC